VIAEPRPTFRLGARGPEVTVRPNLLRGPSVEVDGRPVARRREGARIYWPIAMDDGSERQLFLTSQLTGLRAVVDGTEYPVERRLDRWELGLAVLPLGLVPFLVGAMGLLSGGVLTSVSLPLLRAPWPAPVRIAAWAVGLAAAIGVGYVTAPLVR
jgi:hypothetical protein